MDNKYAQNGRAGVSDPRRKIKIEQNHRATPSPGPCLSTSECLFSFPRHLRASLPTYLRASLPHPRLPPAQPPPHSGSHGNGHELQPTPAFNERLTSTMDTHGQRQWKLNGSPNPCLLIYVVCRVLRPRIKKRAGRRGWCRRARSGQNYGMEKGKSWGKNSWEK